MARSNQTTLLGKLLLGTAQLGRAPEDSSSVEWSQSSQLGFELLGLMQLGYVDPGSLTPPVIPVPDMSTWYIAMSQPARPIIEVEGY
jgi:hypothetical protein